MARKKASAETRKTQIIEATMRCFQRKGFENTTVDDIAAEYGLSKGSIYCYYPSKRDILIAVFNHLINKLFNMYESFLQSDTSAKQKLVQMGKAVANTLLREHKVYRPIMVLWSVALEDASLREISGELYKKGDQLLKELLEQGEKEGEFVVANKDAMSALLIAIGEGFFTRQILMNDLPVDEIEEEMVNTIENLLPPPKKSVKSKSPKVRKELIINTLTQEPGGKWEKSSDEYLELKDVDVVLRVGLPKKEQTDKRKKGKGKK